MDSLLADEAGRRPQFPIRAPIRRAANDPEAAAQNKNVQTGDWQKYCRVREAMLPQMAL